MKRRGGATGNKKSTLTDATRYLKGINPFSHEKREESKIASDEKKLEKYEAAMRNFRREDPNEDINKILDWSYGKKPKKPTLNFPDQPIKFLYPKNDEFFKSIQKNKSVNLDFRYYVGKNEEYYNYNIFQGTISNDGSLEKGFLSLKIPKELHSDDELVLRYFGENPNDKKIVKMFLIKYDGPIVTNSKPIPQIISDLHIKIILEDETSMNLETYGIINGRIDGNYDLLGFDALGQNFFDVKTDEKIVVNAFVTPSYFLKEKKVTSLDSIEINTFFNCSNQHLTVKHNTKFSQKSETLEPHTFVENIKISTFVSPISPGTS